VGNIENIFWGKHFEPTLNTAEAEVLNSGLWYKISKVVLQWEKTHGRSFKAFKKSMMINKF